MPPKKSPENAFLLKTNACSKYIILSKEKDTTWSNTTGATALKVQPKGKGKGRK